MNPTEEEEFHFYKVISDVEELIEKYGADYIMQKLRYPVYMEVFRHFERQ
jgi:hypothetical protein